MNILIVITPFDPAQTPNTIRWNAIIKEFIKNGYKVTVLTTLWTDRNSFEEKDSIKIYRTGHHTLLDFLWNMLGVHKRRNVSSQTALRKPGFFKTFIEKSVNYFWRKRYWPDGSVLFLKPGKKIIPTIINEESISHVISIGLPFTCHLVVKEVKLNHPDVHWMMDVQDPFSISDKFWVNNFSKYAMKNICAEEECLGLADEIIFTNKKVVEIYKELFPKYNQKYKVIPPIFVPPEHDKLELNKEVVLNLDPSKKHLAYFGSFYTGVRSPFRFLKFIDKLHKEHKASVFNMKFHFYGELNKFSKPIFLMFDHLSPYIEHHGFIKHSEVHKHIEQYDALLNFGNITNYHLPSKVVELLYYNKPVINISSVQDDSAKLFLSRKIDFFNLQLDTSLTNDNTEDFIAYVFQEHEKEVPSIEGMSNYLPKQISERYASLMKS